MFSAGSLDTWPKFVQCTEMYGSPVRIAVPDVDRTAHLLIIGAMTGSAAVFTLGLGLIGTALAIFAVILLCYLAVGVCRGVGHFFRWVGGKVSKGRAAK